jgi:hypothetical protein
MFPVDAFGARSTRVLTGAIGALSRGKGATEGQTPLREAIQRGGLAASLKTSSSRRRAAGLDRLRGASSIPATPWSSIARAISARFSRSGRRAPAPSAGTSVQPTSDKARGSSVRTGRSSSTNPTFHNPTGWTMPIPLRRDFLALASRLRVPIIEDNTYRELHLGAAPPPSLLARHAVDCDQPGHLLQDAGARPPPRWLTAAPPIARAAGAHQPHPSPRT